MDKIDSGRLHGLDALRAAMMLLGIVLHTCLSYSWIYMGKEWPYQDPDTTYLAYVAVFFIHIFRMPVFFVVAGFFAAMLFQRRGAGGMLRNRVQRIALPLIIFLPALHPFVEWGFYFANAMLEQPLAQSLAIVAEIDRGELLLPYSTLHLWFLYYLFLYCLAGVGLSVIWRALPRQSTDWATGLFGAMLNHSVWRIIVPAIATALTLYPMYGVLATSNLFLPRATALLGYGVFFVFGWCLYGHRDRLSSFTEHAWVSTLGAGVVFVVAEMWVSSQLGLRFGDEAEIVLRCVSNALIAWMLVYGLTGLALRYLGRPSPLVRYAVDASYWVYLVHLPLAIWIPGLISGLDLSVWTKIAIVIVAITAITVATYDLFVRSTAIGRLLNGRRYPRGLPDLRRPSVAGS